MIRSGQTQTTNTRIQTTAPYDTVNGFGVQRISSGWIGITQRVPIEKNTYYTLSAYIKWEDENNKAIIAFYDNYSLQSGTLVTSQVGTTEYKRVSVTFNSGDGTYSTCRFECFTNTPYLIYGYKLEKGNKATDWTPAPEDYLPQASLVSNWTTNTTWIDGGKIYTGSITADKIDVNSIFAKDITATGTITGANLIGATGTFSGQIAATEGNIGRYDITSTYLMTNSGSNASGIGGNQAFWAGAEDSNSAPFRVGYDGSFVAENATIYGNIKTGNIGDAGDTAWLVDGHLSVQGTANDTNIYSTWFKFGIGGDYYLKSVSDGVECYRNLYATDFIAGGWIYNASGGHYTWKDRNDAYISCGNYNNTNNVYYYAGYHAFYVNGDSGSGMMYIETSGVSSRKGFRNSSDERIKKDFRHFDDDFINSYMQLEPIKYRFKDDTDNSYHIGFKAQNVNGVLNDYGKFHNEQFGICATHHIDPEYAKKTYGEKNMTEVYTLAYDELIGANTFMIQKTRKDLMYQAGRIDMQEAIINDLQTRLLQAEKTIKQLTQALA
jgi:hypothetical protein